MMRIGRPQAALLILLPVALAAAMYARFFGGFWLGDDIANLHRTWFAAQRGGLLAQTWSELAGAVPSQGAFYRPLMTASLSLNQWLAADRFAGWFAFSFFVHLANAALVAALVARLAAACGREGRVSGALAAAFFAVCPLLAEGVFWVSARSDPCATLLTLAGLFLWAATPSGAKAWAGLPLLLVPALGFKESAAVLPLQMLVIALGWPRRPARGQLAAIVAAFAVAAAFLGYRAYLFGDAWHVYPAGEPVSPIAKLWQGVRSLDAWWHGLARATPGMAPAYLVACVLAFLAAATSAKGDARRLALALTLASAGLAAATLLNLGGLVPTGEGGRLAYGPVAWLALALGVGLARPAGRAEVDGDGRRARGAGMLLLAVATATGMVVLEGELGRAYAAQRDVHALAEAARAWPETHSGLTLLVIPERRDGVVTTRNGQGGLVLPPVQRQTLLHRVLPTLPEEIDLRHAQLANGLATRLDKVRPKSFDEEEIRLISVPDVPRWPEHYGCWDSASQSIVELNAPEPEQGAHWAAEIRKAIARCGL